MKRIIFAWIIGFLLLSGSSFAYELNDAFKDFNLLKNISGELIAGSSDYFEIQFSSSLDPTNYCPYPLVLRINATSKDPEHPVWKGDFSMHGSLKSGNENPISMVCMDNWEDIPETDFITEFYRNEIRDAYKGNPIPNGTFFCYNQREFPVVKSGAVNLLNITVTSNPALYPAEYVFSTELMGWAGIPALDPHNTTDEKGNALIPLGDTNVIIEAGKPDVKFRVILYGIILVGEKFPAERPLPLYYMEISASETTNAKVKITYKDEELRGHGLSEKNLRVYHYNFTEDAWEIVRSGVNGEENYIWTDAKGLGLLGVFTAEIQCGDGYCDYGETPDSCPQDCPKPSPPGRRVSHISGGFLPPCEENWTCTEWSVCINGEQTRNCTDQNKCGTTYDKPAVKQACETGLPKVCKPGTRTCSGLKLMECGEGNKWFRIKTCENYCSGGKCTEKPSEIQPGKQTEEAGGPLTGMFLDPVLTLYGAFLVILLSLAVLVYWKAR